MVRVGNKGLEIDRVFTCNLEEDKSVWDLFEWKQVDIQIKNFKTGEIIFEGKDLEFPRNFSQNACEIIAKMYFRKAGVPGLGYETSYRQVVTRMVSFWVAALIDEGVIQKDQEKVLFDELAYAMCAQMWAPNSPQWFNTGLKMAYGIAGEGNGLYYYDEEEKMVKPCRDSYSRTAASACFITDIHDSLLGEQSIMDSLTTASRLFKYGSGIGMNWSKLRAKGEPLSSGGSSSGLLSFQKVFDENAGAIKSGGSTRRASVLMALDIDHPEIEEFVRWKAKEEDKVAALGKMGYSTDLTGEAYETVSGQNVNNSIVVTDDFMREVDNVTKGGEGTITLKGRISDIVDKEVPVKDLWNDIVWSAWRVGDPGLLFRDTINKWNTCAKNGQINTSNPCFTGKMRLLTKDGYVPIGELSGKEVELVNRNGDVVMGRVFCSGAKHTIILRLSTGDEIECTPDHPFLNRHFGEESRILAKDMLGKSMVPYDGHPRENEIDPHFVEMGERDHQLYLDKDYQYFLENQKASYLRGIFNKNGHMHLNGVILRTPYQSFAEDICDALRDDFQIESRVRANCDNAAITYELRIEGFRSISEFSRRIAFTAKEKNDALEALLSTKSPKVVGIREGSVQLVYDFEEPATHWGVVEGIIAHNCGEFLFLDNSACNLASINVLKFLHNGKVVMTRFNHLVELVQLVLEATIHWGAFPTKEIAENSYMYRPTGLGISNLGALLMVMGHPYDSDAARANVQFIISNMTATSYMLSAKVASVIGPFPRFKENRATMQNVLRLHAEAVENINFHRVDTTIGEFRVLEDTWDSVLECAMDTGFRNAQVTLMAPCGTISFAMDCSSTGIEPFFAHIVWKKVVDGSYIQMVNPIVKLALLKLKYTEREVNEILAYMKENGGMIEDAPHLITKHLPIFDTANRNGLGKRYISPTGHVDMVAAIQPHISGGQSKTINLPSTATYEDISNIYQYAWRSGCKGITVYRDGCKVCQPLNSATDTEKRDELDELSYQELLAYAKKKRESLATGFVQAKNIEIEGLQKRIEELEGDLEHVSECLRAAEAECERLKDEKEVVEETIMMDPKQVHAKLQSALQEVRELRRDLGHVERRNMDLHEEVDQLKAADTTEMVRARRERLPNQPRCIKNSVKMDGYTYHIQRSFYDDGRLGEIFVTVGKQGSTIKGLVEVMCIIISKFLQYGVKPEIISKILRNTEYAPNGLITGHENIKSATSITDLISKFIDISVGDYRFCQVKPKEPDTVKVEMVVQDLNSVNKNNRSYTEATVKKAVQDTEETDQDIEGERVYGRVCQDCGSDKIVKAGTCYYCQSCGSSTGCS